MNYFTLLALEQNYNIDVALLKKNYLLKQTEYHPDTAKTDTLKIKNVEISLLINEAYKTLIDDYERAKYLLELNGFASKDGPIGQAKLSAGELEKILQEYEKIEDLRDIADLKRLEQQKIKEKADIVAALGEQFRMFNFAKALDITMRLKYLTNLMGNIKLKIRNANNRN